MCYLRGSVSQVDWIPLSLVCSGCYSWQIYNITIQTVWSNSRITINNKLSVSQRMWDISSPNITLDTDIPIYRSDTWNDSLMIEYKYLPGEKIFQVSAAWKYCVRGREGVSWLLPLNYTNFLLKSDREREGRWGVNRSRFYCFISLLWGRQGPTCSHVVPARAELWSKIKFKIIIRLVYLHCSSCPLRHSPLGFWPKWALPLYHSSIFGHFSLSLLNCWCQLHVAQ